MVTELALTSTTAVAIQQELTDRIKVFFPDWTDNQDSNNMIMLLEQIAGVFELEYAYINRLARECFIQYALDPANVFAHARGLGYTPQYQTPAMVTAVIQSASPVTADTVVPKGTQFTCNLSGVIYETSEDTTIPSGQTSSPDVTLKQQQSWIDSYTGTGAPNQNLVLNQIPVMPVTIGMTVDGVVWNYVSNFVDSTSTDFVFTNVVDSNGVCTIVWGNGVTGKKPVLNAAVSITYSTGGGSANTIGPNQLTTCISDVRDGGNNVLLSLNAFNEFAAVPGSDVETAPQVVTHALANLKAPRVLLTRQDIQDFVSTLSGVQLCTVVNWEVNPQLPHYMVQIFLIPVGGGQPTSDLEAAVLNAVTVTKPAVMGVKVFVFGPTYRTLNFNIQLGILSGFTSTTVQNTIRQTMIALFNPAVITPGFTIGFGLPVFMSQIIAILQQLPGVQNIAILAPGDTVIGLNEYPVLGTVSFV